MRHAGRIALLWLILIILPLPLVILLDRLLVDIPANLAVYDLGIIAYVWWLADIILATRPRRLANWLTLPTLYLTHGLLGVFALVAATFHKFLAFSMFPLIKQTGNIAWYLEVGLMVYAVIFLAGWLVDRVPAIRALKAFLERVLFRHQVTIWLHRLNWLAVALIWLHVHLIARLNLPAFRWTFDLYTVVTVVIYLAWQWRQKWGLPTGTVTANKPVGTDLQEVTIDLPAGAHYHAGDFYFLSFRDRQEISGESHPFSVSSAPRKSPAAATLTIQRRGDFTRRLANVTTGTPVKLAGPYGQFDQEVATSTGPVILYGLGTGVAPLLGLAEQYAGTKPLHLVWTGKQTAIPLYRDRLQELQAAGVKVDTSLHRYTPADLYRLLTSEELTNGTFLIVGSAAKVVAVERTLHRLGVVRRNLHDERLTM